MKHFFIILIRVYKLLLSPLLSKRVCCKFHPTCSDYAIGVLNKYGTAIGLKKTISRLSRCNPYNGDSCIDYP